MKYPTTSDYLPTISELPAVEKPWIEMRWQKEDNEEKIGEVYFVTSTRRFLAADNRKDLKKSLKEAQTCIQELESDLQNPDLSQEERMIAQNALTEYTKSAEYVKNLLENASEEEKEYHEYVVHAETQLFVSISYSDNIWKLWGQNMEKMHENPLFKDRITSVDMGDEGIRAVHEITSLLYFVKGDYLIMVSAVGDPELAEEVGRIIESKLLTTILLLSPVQVLHDDVPLISGKKMGVFVAVESRRDMLDSNEYALVLEVSKNQFLQNEYSIQLNADSRTYNHIKDADDGGTWNREIVTTISDKNDIIVCLSYFGIKRTAENVKKIKIKIFRFLLDPVDMDYNGDYEFKAFIMNSEKRKIATRITTRRTVKSATLKIAIIPIRVGWWAHPKNWLEKIPELENDKDFVDTAWTDINYTEFMESLSEQELKKIENVKKRIKRAITGGRGKILYSDTARKMAHFAKGVFPLAEEALTITILEDQPHNLLIDPKETLDPIFEKVNAWAKKSSYDRVVAIVPGTSPGQGGIDFYMNPAVGVALWYIEHAVMVALQAWDSIAAHELAHTYGAIDEYGQDITDGLPEWAQYVVGPVSYMFIWFQDQRTWLRHAAAVLQTYIENLKKKLNQKWPINSCVGMPGGHQVMNGFWAARGKFMGTPQDTKNSLMGQLDNAWITTELYEGIRKQISKE
jgi:hypothetical protein